MRIAKVSKYTGLVLLVLIIATEIILRLSAAYKLEKWSPCQYQPDPVLGYRYKPNSTGSVYDALEDYREFRTTYKDVVIKYTDTSQNNLDAAKAYIDHELSTKSFRLYLYDYSYIYRGMVIILNTYATDDAAYKKQLFAKNVLNYLPLQLFRKDEFSFGELNGHSSQEGHKAVGIALFNALKDSIPGKTNPVGASE